MTRNSSMQGITPLRLSDVDGAARLAVAGVLGVTDLVEQLHGTIARTVLPIPAPESRPTRGITRLVYGSVRGVTGLVGGALRLGLGTAAALQGPTEGSSAARIRTQAILNGVLGDTLERGNNPLALPMQLLHRGQETTAECLRTVLAPGSKVALLVHGLCLDEACWDAGAADTAADDLPQRLEQAGWTVLRLRYNSGRPIHANGRDLSILLDALVAESGIVELALIGHSMGGLVARSAAHYGLEARHRWPDRLGRLVCIATPHHGAPLERIGHVVDRTLEISRYSAPFARLGRVRSTGIIDLRHGRITECNSISRLPPGTACFSLAATLDQDPASLRSRHLGDGLVPVPTALGVHRDPARALPIPAAQRHVIAETGHLAVLHAAEAVDRVVAWLDD